MAEGSRIERPGRTQPPVFKAGCAPCTVPSSGGERRNRTAVPEDSACFPDKVDHHGRRSPRMGAQGGIRATKRASKKRATDLSLVGRTARRAVWCPRRDSNLHCPGFEAGLSAVGVLGRCCSSPPRDSNSDFTGSKPAASAVGLGGDTVRAARFELALSTLSTLPLCQLGYARAGAESGDRTQLYPLVERATSPAVSLRFRRVVQLWVSSC